MDHSGSEANGYVISLAHRNDRLRDFQGQMASTGLAIDTFTAVNGKDLNLAQFKPRMNPWFVEFGSERLIRGVIGTQLSHRAIWQKISTRPDGLYFVFEDDARLKHPTFSGLLGAIATRCPPDADFVWLNAFDPLDRIRLWPRLLNRINQLTGPVRLGERIQGALERIRLALVSVSFRRWVPIVYTTTEAYLVRPRYAARLLEYNAGWIDSIDIQIRIAAENIGGKFYRARPPLFIQDGGPSDTYGPG